MKSAKKKKPVAVEPDEGVPPLGRTERERVFSNSSRR